MTMKPWVGEKVGWACGIFSASVKVHLCLKGGHNRRPSLSSSLVKKKKKGKRDKVDERENIYISKVRETPVWFRSFRELSLLILGAASRRILPARNPRSCRWHGKTSGKPLNSASSGKLNFNYIKGLPSTWANASSNDGSTPDLGAEYSNIPKALIPQMPPQPKAKKVPFMLLG